MNSQFKMFKRREYDQIPSFDIDSQDSPAKKNTGFALRLVSLFFFFLSILCFVEFFPQSSDVTEPILTTSLPLFDDEKKYIFHDFDLRPPFSSFLPGLGGLWGIPM